MLRKLLTIALIAAIVGVQANAQTAVQTNIPADAQTLAQERPEPAAELHPGDSPSPRVPEKPNQAEVVKPGKARISAGTTLEFGLITPLSSATAKAGDDVPLRLLRPLVAGDTTLLAEGTIVHGRVVTVSSAGPNCHQGDLQLAIDRLSFPDGSTVKVENGLITADDTKLVPYKTSLSWDPNWLEITGLAIVLVPLVVVGAALYVVFIGPAYLLGIYSDFTVPSTPCTTAGNDIELPATTRVAVIVRKNHTVRF